MTGKSSARPRHSVDVQTRLKQIAAITNLYERSCISQPGNVELQDAVHAALEGLELYRILGQEVRTQTAQSRDAVMKERPTQPETPPATSNKLPSVLEHIGIVLSGPKQSKASTSRYKDTQVLPANAAAVHGDAESKESQGEPTHALNTIRAAALQACVGCTLQVNYTKGTLVSVSQEGRRQTVHVQIRIQQECQGAEPVYATGCEFEAEGGRSGWAKWMTSIELDVLGSSAALISNELRSFVLQRNVGVKSRHDESRRGLIPLDAYCKWYAEHMMSGSAAGITHEPQQKAAAAGINANTRPGLGRKVQAAGTNGVHESVQEVVHLLGSSNYDGSPDDEEGEEDDDHNRGSFADGIYGMEEIAPGSVVGSVREPPEALVPDTDAKAAVLSASLGHASAASAPPLPGPCMSWASQPTEETSIVGNDIHHTNSVQLEPKASFVESMQKIHGDGAVSSLHLNAWDAAVPAGSLIAGIPSNAAGSNSFAKASSLVRPMLAQDGACGSVQDGMSIKLHVPMTNAGSATSSGAHSVVVAAATVAVNASAADAVAWGDGSDAAKCSMHDIAPRSGGCMTRREAQEHGPSPSLPASPASSSHSSSLAAECNAGAGAEEPQLGLPPNSLISHQVPIGAAYCGTSTGVQGLCSGPSAVLQHSVSRCDSQCEPQLKALSKGMTEAKPSGTVSGHLQGAAAAVSEPSCRLPTDTYRQTHGSDHAYPAQQDASQHTPCMDAALPRSGHAMVAAEVHAPFSQRMASVRQAVAAQQARAKESEVQLANSAKQMASITAASRAPSSSKLCTTVQAAPRGASLGPVPGIGISSGGSNSMGVSVPSSAMDARMPLLHVGAQLQASAGSTLQLQALQADSHNKSHCSSHDQSSGVSVIQLSALQASAAHVSALQARVIELETQVAWLQARQAKCNSCSQVYV